ncbi:MAG: helix-turn-helix transcriptional regulator [Metamycoplasma hominis]|nr:helix-turn-helix transcriptional regulator [Metamycoplasma hominis]
MFVRAKLNLSQEQLAKELNVTFATVNRWENARMAPTKKVVLRFYEFCKEKNVKFEK